MGTSLLVFCDAATREKSSHQVYVKNPQSDGSESGLPGLIRWDQRCGWALLKFCTGIFPWLDRVRVCMVFVFVGTVCMCGNGPWSDLLINGQCVYVWKRSWSCFHANELQQMGERRMDQQRTNTPAVIQLKRPTDPLVKCFRLHRNTRRHCDGSNCWFEIESSVAQEVMSSIGKYEGKQDTLVYKWQIARLFYSGRNHLLVVLQFADWSTSHELIIFRHIGKSITGNHILVHLNLNCCRCNWWNVSLLEERSILDS